MQILEVQDRAQSTRRGDDVHDALFPLSEKAHPGDQPTRGDGVDVGDLVQIEMAGVALGFEEVGDGLRDQRALSATRGADQHERRTTRAGQMRRDLAPLGLSGSAEVQDTVRDLAREVSRLLSERRQPALSLRAAGPRTVLVLLQVVPEALA